ncbi:hypothetical protein OQE61_04745 [Cetobacterium somerae]|uniref:hypothetical protein n=1 Tax=Cetobacterium somerae TaxID=188913 RepID=UPI00225592B0|nr:hypothetical protein [Cetobacterium somerae]MCX3066798.1 hypothetical protein [Cetobacterium somerae]
MRRLHLFVTTFLIIISTTFSFHITPTFFEKRIDGSGGYEEYVLKNNTNETVRYKIEFLPGLGKFGHMDKWVEYNPKIITIKPQSQSTLKVYIKAPKGTTEGEYSTLLNAKTIPVPKLEKQPNEVAAAARLGLNINVEIVGYVGDLVANLEITNLKVNEDKEGKAIVIFDVKNNTLKRGVYYSVEVLESNGNFETTEKGRVGVGKTDKVKITLDKMKKRDIVGVRIRETATRREITNKKL